MIKKDQNASLHLNWQFLESLAVRHFDSALQLKTPRSWSRAGRAESRAVDAWQERHFRRNGPNLIEGTAVNPGAGHRDLLEEIFFQGAETGGELLWGEFPGRGTLGEVVLLGFIFEFVDCGVAVDLPFREALRLLCTVALYGDAAPGTSV